jgi:ABC-type amino acid transport substrate-binding protein
MAHELARTLGTTLDFVPVTLAGLHEEMTGGCCDLIMSGIVITPARAEKLPFSVPYFEEHVAFLTTDYRRKSFARRDTLRALSSLRLGVPSASYIRDAIRDYAPNAELDAFVMSAERGAIWSIRQPRLSVVIPDPPIMTVPLAYVIGEGDEHLRLFVNTWIDLLQRDGTIEELQDHWVYGKNAVPQRPRWSVIRDVLGWVD